MCRRAPHGPVRALTTSVGRESAPQATPGTPPSWRCRPISPALSAPPLTHFLPTALSGLSIVFIKVSCGLSVPGPHLLCFDYLIVNAPWLIFRHMPVASTRSEVSLAAVRQDLCRIGDIASTTGLSAQLTAAQAAVSFPFAWMMYGSVSGVRRMFSGSNWSPASPSSPDLVRCQLLGCDFTPNYLPCARQCFPENQSRFGISLHRSCRPAPPAFLRV